MQRVILIVLDSVGVGALPDAAQYGDTGSNTLKHTALTVGGLQLPNLRKLGLGNIIDVLGIDPISLPEANFGKMMERSPGKDTTTGHWELTGLILDKPFPVYPRGFPRELISVFEKRIGKHVLGNKPASGTVIIEELGEEHLRTGYPIVYTSADSVFQIAAHEEIIPVDELYGYCQVAREMLVGEHGVGRVIARPFSGTLGKFQRTERRRDFSLSPPQKTVLDCLQEKDLTVIGIGKIDDIFNAQGISLAVHTRDNHDGFRQTLTYFQKLKAGLIFTNLIDFDMQYGHRNDVKGYARALEEFDRQLPGLTTCMEHGDVLIITADHGCDPTTSSTDHSREYVPLLIYGPGLKKGINLGIRDTFADVGATIAALLGVSWDGAGKSMEHLVL